MQFYRTTDFGSIMLSVFSLPTRVAHNFEYEGFGSVDVFIIDKNFEGVELIERVKIYHILKKIIFTKSMLIII